MQYTVICPLSSAGLFSILFILYCSVYKKLIWDASQYLGRSRLNTWTFRPWMTSSWILIILFLTLAKRIPEEKKMTKLLSGSTGISLNTRKSHSCPGLEGHQNSPGPDLGCQKPGKFHCRSGQYFFLDIHLWPFMRIIFGKQQEKKSRGSVISHSVQAAEVVLGRGRPRFKALPWCLIGRRAIDKDMPAMRNPVDFFCIRRIFELKMPAAFDNTLFISRVLFCRQRRQSPDFPQWGISRLPSETNYSSTALIGLSEPGEKPASCSHFQEARYSLQ